MTLKKKPDPRTYETFPSSSEPGDISVKSPSDTSRRSAGLEAQRLASQGLWSENYISRTPLTPNSEMGVAEEPYPREEYPADPPPIYTPSETTADQSSIPPSPVMARSQPHAQPVGEPRSSTEDVAYPTIREDAEDESPGAEPYASSPLLERAQSQPDEQPQGCARWNTEARKHRRRRFRKACWFSCALAICLWMMLPALFGDSVLSALSGLDPHTLICFIRPEPVALTGTTDRTARLTILRYLHGLFPDASTANTRRHLRSPVPSSSTIFSISRLRPVASTFTSNPSLETSLL